MTDECVNAVCTTRTFAYTCWQLSDFSEECEDVSLDDVPVFSPDLTLYLLRDFIQRQVSQERNYMLLQNLLY